MNDLFTRAVQDCILSHGLDNKLLTNCRGFKQKYSLFKIAYMAYYAAAYQSEAARQLRLYKKIVGCEFSGTLEEFKALVRGAKLMEHLDNDLVWEVISRSNKTSQALMADIGSLLESLELQIKAFSKPALQNAMEYAYSFGQNFLEMKAEQGLFPAKSVEQFLFEKANQVATA